MIERALDSRWPGQLEYRFRHALLRDAAYGLLTDDDRRTGHRLAGTALERLGERDPLVLADHYQRGGALEQAAPWYCQAAQAAMTNNDLAGALRITSAGLGCGPQGELRGQLISIMAICNFWSDDFQASLPFLFEPLQLLPRGSSSWVRAARAALTTTGALGRGAEFAMSIALFGSTECAPDAHAEYSETACYITTICSYLGQRASALMWIDKLKQITQWSMPKHASDQSFLLLAQSQFEMNLGANPWGRYQFASGAFNGFQDVNDLRNYTMVTAFVGASLLELGRADEAERRLQKDLKLAIKLQAHLNVPIIIDYIALCQISSGEPARAKTAEHLIRETLAQYSTNINPLSRGYMLDILAQSLIAQARHREAEELAKEALAIMEPFPSIGIYTHATLSTALRQHGKLAAARTVAEAGLARLESIVHGGFWEMSIHLAVTEARLAAGDLIATRAALHDTLAQIQIRADRIEDEAFRTSYLNQNKEVLRARELGRTLLGRDPFAPRPA
jgi:tetratricopeptide (TPR) repeat protein